jgi:hypothetical protein
VLRVIRVVPIVVVLLVLHNAVRAEPEAESEAEVERDWYGWHIMLADAGVVAVSLASGRNAGPGVATIGLLASGPVVHLAHHHGARAAGSLWLRVGLPAAGLILGAQMGACSAKCDAPGGGVILGFGLGALTALILDDAVLAWDDRPPPAPSSPVVSLVPTRGGAALALAGSF